jgi:O-antigen ligase
MSIDRCTLVHMAFTYRSRAKERVGQGEVAAWKAPRERAIYLWVALAFPPLVTLTQYIDPTTVYFKGQPASILLGLIGIVLTFLLWIPYRKTSQITSLAKFAIAMIVVCWLVQTFLIQYDDSLFNLLTFALPSILIMVLLKPPTSRDVFIAALVFSYTLILIATIGLLLDAMHLTSSAFIASRNGYSRIPFLSDVIGIDTRWEGPFGNVNYAAPVGGFLVVFGASVGRPHRIPLLIGGLVILVLSQGRSALVATVAGLLVVFLGSNYVNNLRNAQAFRIVLLSGTFLIIASYIWVFDRTFAFRTDVWLDYAALWRESPWLGVGTSGINDYASQGSGLNDIHHTHGHSVFIDILTRHGIVMFSLTVTTIVVILLLNIRAYVHGAKLGLPLFVFTVVAGLVETTLSWSYFGFLTIPLILSLLFSVQMSGRE